MSESNARKIPKVARVMGEWKRGTLRSSSGAKVTSHDQAVAIALSEAGLSNQKDMGAGAVSPAMSSVNATAGGSFVPPPSFADGGGRAYHWTPRPFRHRKLKRIAERKSLLAQLRRTAVWGKAWQHQARMLAGTPTGGRFVDGRNKSAATILPVAKRLSALFQCPAKKKAERSAIDLLRNDRALWKKLCERQPNRTYVWETKDFGPSFALDLPFMGKPQFNEEEFSITFPFAASHGRDRVGDFLDVAGIDTANHRRNPVAFIDHGKNVPLPIGKCEDPTGNYTVKIYPEQGLAIATVFLDKDPENKVVRQVFNLFKQGILRAGSIGYRPKNKPKRLPADPDTGTPEGNLLDKTELLEVTLTGLPANGDAVRAMLLSGWEGKGAWEPAVKFMLESMLSTAA